MLPSHLMFDFFSTKKVCLILPVENKVFCLSGNPSLTHSIPLAFRG